MAKPGDTHFVLARLNWRRTPAGLVRLPGEHRVGSFDSADEARVAWWDREQAARATVNPFAAGFAPFDQTSLPGPVFRDWLLDAGVEPPQRFADPKAWGPWWEKESANWSDGQRAKVWEALDRVRFFEVSERPRVPVGYAVVEVVWAYNDEWFYADGEGGVVQMVYRSRAKAESACAERAAAARAQWRQMVGDWDVEGDDEEAGAFEVSGRLSATADPFAPEPTRRRKKPADYEGTYEGTHVRLDAAPFFEVIEVELEGLA